MTFCYQDDLRAGVFQYIDSTSSAKDPCPYQVIFDNPSGIMIWCYPEPRALTRVDIHPLPFVAASSPSQPTNKDRVACVLQFYDPLRADFITYRQFLLSESKYHQLELPSLYEKQQVAVSTTWRVWIDYSEDDSGSLRPGGGHLLVPPSALAACMRVDSIFSPRLLPHTQFVVSCKKLTASLQNHMHLVGKKFPPEVESVRLETDVPEVHGVMEIHLSNTVLRGNFWSTSLFCDFKSTLEVEIMDYVYLTLSPLLSSTDISTKLLVVDSVCVDKPRCVDLKTFIKPLSFHLSQLTLQSLSICTQSFSQALEVVQDVTIGPSSSTQLSLPMPLACRYIIYNACQEGVRLGQAETEENRLLEAGQSLMYCWRSNKHPPLLRLCRKWRWTKPFSIDEEGITVTSSSSKGSVSGEGSSHHRSVQIVVTVTLSRDRHVYVTLSSLVTIVNCLYDDVSVKLLTKDVLFNRSHNNVFALR